MDNKETSLDERQTAEGKAQEPAEEKAADVQELTDHMMEKVDGGDHEASRSCSVSPSYSRGASASIGRR